jgi:hypothetical protein
MHELGIEPMFWHQYFEIISSPRTLPDDSIGLTAMSAISSLLFALAQRCLGWRPGKSGLSQFIYRKNKNPFQKERSYNVVLPRCVPPDWKLKCLGGARMERWASFTTMEERERKPIRLGYAAIGFDRRIQCME